MEKYTVKIAGTELTVRSDEPAEYVQGLARLLDQRMTSMLASGNHIVLSEAALFCALDYFDDKLKTSLRLEKLQGAFDRLTKENAALRADNAELLAMLDSAGIGGKKVSLFDAAETTAQPSPTPDNTEIDEKA